MRAWVVGAFAIAGCGRLSFDPLAIDDGSVATGDGTTQGFLDTFDRPNQAGIGNGWIENTPGVYSITGNQVTRVASSSAWTTNHVYRPTSEDVADIAISLEFVTTDVTNPDWPQIFVRGDAGESAYYAWVEYGPSGSSTVNVDLARDDRAGTGWIALDQKPVPLATVGDRYRLRLSAKGYDPVVVAGGYDKWDGSAWQTLVSLSGQDTDLTKEMAGGHWGFSGNQLFACTYDNFSMTRL